MLTRFAFQVSTGPTVQARVVERRLVGEVQQRPLVLRTGEDLQQLGVECHVDVSSGFEVTLRI